MPHIQSFHSVAALPGSSLAEGEPPESDDRVAGEALIARESDLVIAVSGYEASTILTRCGAPADRVVIVRPGVDEAMFRPARPGAVDDLFDWSSIGLAAPLHDQYHCSAAGVALVAARLQPLKGVDLAIRGLARVPQPQRPVLVLAGDASADHRGYADRLRALAAQHEVAVELTGPQERRDLARMLRSAVLVLVPSYSETFGLIALEAQASGAPVAIWAGAGGLNEIVSEETGLVFSDRDPGHWGAGIADLLADPVRRAEMSRAAVVRAHRFSWPRAARHLAAAYRKLLRG